MKYTGASASPTGCSQAEPVVSALRASPPSAPPLTIGDLAEILATAFRQRLTVKKIQQTVSEFYGIHPSYMTRPDGIGARDWRVSHPRQAAMFLSRKLTGMALQEIGRRFGGRDHSTVIHSLRAVERRAAGDSGFELELELLRDRLTIHSTNVANSSSPDAACANRATVGA
jgi:chromosomal replication initiator protein